MPLTVAVDLLAPRAKGGMFIQVIEGRVADLERLRLQGDRWQEELMPGAEGFLERPVSLTTGQQANSQ